MHACAVSAAPSVLHVATASRAMAVSAWLAHQPQWIVCAFALLPAFSTYMCMYGYRKAYTALTYEGMAPVASIDFKTLAVVLQLLGYATSKVLATKFSSEASYRERVRNVLLLVGLSEGSLLCFAIMPAPFNLPFLFLNGLPLGMVWSMLFGLLEGRRITEFLALSMASSQIFASGWAKAVGLWLLNVSGCQPFWMPALSGLVFAPLLLGSLWLLGQLPPPSAADEAARTPRKPMSGTERVAFLKLHFWGVLPLCTVELCLVVYRDLRDSFMPDILRELDPHAHEATDPATFASVDVAGGCISIVLLSLLSAVRDTRLAVRLQCAVVTLGGLLCGAGA